jgi:uncharacterized protein YceK
VLKMHPNKLVCVWKYVCIGDRTLHGLDLYESAVLDTLKATYSHVLSADGTEIVTAY